MRQAAECAKAIKQELKKAFPKVKFSIRSDYFAGGNAVRIRWQDGPKTKEVDEIVGKYQYGHFDGMTDCYNYSNSREDIPQAKYVQTQRDISDTTRDAILADLEAKYGRKFDYNGYDSGIKEYVSTIVWRIFQGAFYY